MKKFDKDDFRKDLEEELKNMESNSYKDFETAFSRALDKHAPKKKNLCEQIANPAFRKLCEWQ